MNIITFTYTKADGKASKRVLSPIVFPSTMYEGIDISELDDQDQGMYIAEIDAARSDFANECFRIQDKYDVKTNYRRFDPLKMSDVIKENI